MKKRPLNPLKIVARVLVKTLLVVILLAVMVIAGTSVSLVYDFPEPRPFSGPDIFNPYRNIDTAYCWKRANFHTHTRVKGWNNECEMWPGEVYDEYMRYGYDIVTFSNHNELTRHPFDEKLQVNVYEHGYNLLKYHKLVFGAKEVNEFDNLLPIFAFQRQSQLDMLSKGSDFIVLNHPLRTPFTTKRVMERLEGYRIIELDSGKSTENEYWDWALSAGHYSFGIANDDLHYPDRSSAIAVRSNFLCAPSARYEDIREVLLDGCYYSMRTPDYGGGDWDEKEARNQHLPYIVDIGLRGDTIFVELSKEAASVEVIGQNHSLLQKNDLTTMVEYKMSEEDTYARFIVRFPTGEVIYTNPFARYDATTSSSPFRTPEHKVNTTLTILWNGALLTLVVGLVMVIRRVLFGPRR